MAAEFGFLQDLTIIIVTALVVGLAVARLRLPMVVGYIASGIVIGPFGLGFVAEAPVLQVVTTLGIVLLLFLIGLELDPLELRKIGFAVIIVTLVEMYVTLVSGVLLGLLLGLGTLNSLFLGAVLSISSTAIVAKILLERRMPGSEGHLLLGVLIVEDLVAVVLLFTLPTIAVAGTVSIVEVAIFALKGIGLFALVVAFGIFAAPKLIDFINKGQNGSGERGELGFLLSLALGVFFALAGAALGFSPAIGAFLMGLMIVGKYSRFVSGQLTPVKDFFIILFFVSMGTLIDPRSFFELGLMVVPIVGVALFSKFFGVWLGVRASRSTGDPTDVGLRMLPRGEFSFVIAKTGIDLGVVTPLLIPIAGVVSLVTAIVGPMALKIRERRTRMPPVEPIS